MILGIVTAVPVVPHVVRVQAKASAATAARERTTRARQGPAGTWRASLWEGCKGLEEGRDKARCKGVDEASNALS